MKINQEIVEKNIGLLIVLVIAVGRGRAGSSRSCRSTSRSPDDGPVAGVRPYPALELAGRDVYLREGCYNCHSQMIRPFPRRRPSATVTTRSPASSSTTIRSSGAASARDLTSRASARATPDEWHRAHLDNPRDVVPESNMPSYPVARQTPLAPEDVQPKMRALRRLGVPYTDDQIAKAPDERQGQERAGRGRRLLQNLGLALRNVK
jgi:cytochrome c oxidase cbb3-type subunit 2